MSITPIHSARLTELRRRARFAPIERFSDGRPMHCVPDPATGEARPANLWEWGLFIEDPQAPGRIVASDYLDSIDEPEAVHVSTVFIGLDGGHGMTNRPLYWETMIFGGAHDQYTDRYSSLREAKAGHAHALKLARRWSWLPLETQAMIGEWHNNSWRFYWNIARAMSCASAALEWVRYG